MSNWELKLSYEYDDNPVPNISIWLGRNIIQRWILSDYGITVRGGQWAGEYEVKAFVAARLTELFATTYIDPLQSLALNEPPKSSTKD